MPRHLLLVATLLAACTRPVEPARPLAAPDAPKVPGPPPAPPPAVEGSHLGPPAPAEVRTLVTLAPSLTSVVLALGAGERLVGVTRFDDDPRVASVVRVGGFSDPSPETILRAKPDLVLCQPSPGNRGAVEAIANSGIPVVVLPLEQSAADVTATVRRLGALLALPAPAEKLVADIEAARARAAAAARKRARKVSVAVLYDLDPLVAAGPGSYPDALLADAGATNVIEASPQRYPHVSLETLLAAAPDALLLAGAEDHARKRANLPESLTVLLTGLDSRAFLQPGPGLPQALDELTAVLDRLAARPLPK
jgi:iron complex transport system substrate-binding protein